MAEEKIESEGVKAETTITKSEVTTIQPADKAAETAHVEEHFEKHVYDCPICKKKLRIHFEGCGCPQADDIFEWTMKHMY